MTTSALLRTGVLLTERAGRGFPSPALVEGFTLFTKGLVALACSGDSAVDATVKSQKTRHVRVRASPNAIGASCTCTPESLDAPRCKHLWATFLAIDKAGMLAALRDARAPLALDPLPPDRPGPKKASAPPPTQPSEKKKAKVEKKPKKKKSTARAKK